ncbi:unnamed protein product [Brassica oleracea]
MVAHTFAFDFHLGVVPKAESLAADPAYMEMPHPKVACSQAPKKPKEQNPKTLTLAGEPTNLIRSRLLFPRLFQLASPS